MRFTILLYIIYLILKRASKKNRDYQNYIGNINGVRIMIKSATGKRGRLFIFDKGTVKSKGGSSQDYDAAIIWSDPGTGFRVMLSMSDEATFHAAAEGKMKLDGMAFFAQWFNDGVKLAMKKYR